MCRRSPPSNRCTWRRWIEMQTRERAAPSVKQQLAAVRHLFDWLVTGQVVPVNPAASVRGPSHVVTPGQDAGAGACRGAGALDSIDLSKPVGLRDRALIGLMVYSFARIGAALGNEGRGRVRAEPPALGAAARERRQGARHAVPPQSNAHTPTAHTVSNSRRGVADVLWSLDRASFFRSPSSH